MSTLRVLEVPFGSQLYREEIDLRVRMLRAPLGLALSADDLKDEERSAHFVAVSDGRCVGCVVLVPGAETGVARLRQMAVETAFQRQGIGALLVKSFEDAARERGYSQIDVAAREAALGFYEKLGYRIFGPPERHFDIPHRKMKKDL